MAENEKTYQDGLEEGRAEGARMEKIHRTVCHLRFLVKNVPLSLEEAMAILEIPKTERKTYRKIFEKRIPKK